MIRNGKCKLRDFSAANVNIVCDGNSIVRGAGANAGEDFPTRMAGFWPLLGTSQTVVNKGVDSVTTPDLTAGSTAPSAFVTGKKNILIFWEVTNDIQNANQSVAQAIDHVATYASTMQAARAWFRKVIVTTIPRNKSNLTKNGTLAAANAAVLSNYRALGFDMAIDIRAGSSPFNFADYSDASFDAVAGYYESNGQFIHPSAAGYMWIAQFIASQLSRLAG